MSDGDRVLILPGGKNFKGLLTKEGEPRKGPISEVSVRRSILWRSGERRTSCGRPSRRKYE